MERFLVSRIPQNSRWVKGKDPLHPMPLLHSAVEFGYTFLAEDRLTTTVTQSEAELRLDEFKFLREIGRCTSPYLCRGRVSILLRSALDGVSDEEPLTIQSYLIESLVQ